MKTKNYSALKSGSDIRGIAVKTAKSDVTLTGEAVCDIARAFLKWLAVRCGKQTVTVALGNDVRISCEVIRAAVEQVAVGCGCRIIYCGMTTTPAMFAVLAESGWDLDGSVMITASHLPFDRNGLKFFTPDGGLSADDISEILSMAERGEGLPDGEGSVEERSYLDLYCKKLVSVVRAGANQTAPLFGKRIIVDASNGVGGFFAKKVLQPLGAITDGSINLHPDGNFPNHEPNPENPEAVKCIADAVVNTHAELGVIFDTDVDRAAIVDISGKVINRDSLIALTSALVLKDGPATIVTDSVTGDGLTEFIEKRGGKHVRFKRGYRNVIDEAIRRNAEGERCPLAIETSGHAAFEENYFMDDGAYLVCKLLVAYALQAEKGAALADLIDDLELPAEEGEVRLSFTPRSKDFKLEGERVIDEIKFFMNMEKGATLSENDYEGARISFDKENGDGWLLIRQSVHDPVLPVNFASMSAGGVKIMAAKLYSMVEKYPFLNTRPLKQFIEK